MNVDPAVLDVVRQSMLGHLDPTYHAVLDELMGMLRAVYGVGDGGVAFPLQATGMSGMETGIVNLVDPGDTVVVGQSGFFGRRIAELARRHGAHVVEIARDWGEAVPNDELLDAVDRHPETRLLAVVHAETSTGVQHPVEELGLEMRSRDALLLVDCVT
jgi:alanine-glyoxylate transaminase / serine-glyoxylate transaminase / serine-pyruvate transaminase